MIFLIQIPTLNHQNGISMYFKDAYHQYQMAGKGSGFPDTFDLIYTKVDGTFGEKKGCSRRPSNPNPESKRDLSSIKHENRVAGKLYLWHPTDGKFEIHACGIIAFNGEFIDHRF
ncbi:hypothetical protein [Cellulophaga sp. BC115SP]|uniref:hypothetical protein n=1 Tax=Cellulophaga sp. BC115SP TaxID=2683263 RepID=UPI001412F4F6|nr:hypothetical protein [Cellulophaga sp. BC115SP]NBB26767.1 hypothetical protein [Cellulophaga sp. BC115SP]